MGQKKERIRGDKMKVYASYKKIEVYPFGEMWVVTIQAKKSLNPIQFGELHKERKPDHMRSLLSFYGFQPVKYEDLDG